jgi:ribosomal-protein-alanine N-acetyltransferase
MKVYQFSGEEVSFSGFSRVLPAEKYSPYFSYFVAKMSGEWAGYIRYQAAADTVEIDDVQVFSNFQRQGVATFLFGALLSEFQRSEFFLEVRTSNIAAINLYESLGFIRIYTRKNYYQHPKEDAYIYKYGAGNESI